jgi:hypothetical protein
MPTCCGAERSSRFCPDCGEELDGVPCSVCGGPATLLCDYILAVEKAGRATPPASSGVPPYDYMSLDSRVFTCDRPLCDSCAVRGCVIFMCGESGGIVTEDFCPDHPARNPDVPVLTAEQADGLRNRRELRLRDG